MRGRGMHSRVTEQVLYIASPPADYSRAGAFAIGAGIWIRCGVLPYRVVRAVVLFNGGMRTRYHENLEGLSQQLQAMCLHARSAVATATGALLKADLREAERTIDLCGEMDFMRERCEHEAVTLLALQSPVGGELRRW